MNIEMKRFLISALVVILSMASYAQTDLTTLQFVDKNGNVVEDGSTITVSEAEYDGGVLQINSGLFVKNTTNEEQGAGVDFVISRLDNGAPQCCFPSTCAPGTDQVGVKYSPACGRIGANESVPFATEWKPSSDKSYGTCTATFQLKVMEVKDKTMFGVPVKDYNTFKAYGPKITINFVYNTTGIDGVQTTDSKVAAYYNLNGQIIPTLQKGVNIVKYANGKTIKIIK